MKSDRIPLFPLEVVLFPGTPLPLHIFEPRYKLMVRRCVENHAEFGVILARQEGIAGVGCTAEVVKIVKTYEDGRMDILTFGRRPYRITEVFDDQPYLEGIVEYVKDDTRQGPGETRKPLIELYEKCHTLIHGRAPNSLEVSPEVSLAFQIASELPLDLELKQELLEIRVESERQNRLLERLNQWLPQLAYLERARGKAGGNGRALR